VVLNRSPFADDFNSQSKGVTCNRNGVPFLPRSRPHPKASETNVTRSQTTSKETFSFLELAELNLAFAEVWQELRRRDCAIGDEDLARRAWQMVIAVACMEGVANYETVAAIVLKCFAH
jgi:hypothetical protein